MYCYSTTMGTESRWLHVDSTPITDSNIPARASCRGINIWLWIGWNSTNSMQGTSRKFV